MEHLRADNYTPANMHTATDGCTIHQSKQAE